MPAPPPAPIDRLAAVLARFPVSARMFHSGPLCAVNPLDAQTGFGYLHVLRRGAMALTQRGTDGLSHSITLNEPSLLFYPNVQAHPFWHVPGDGAECTCAAIHFEGGANHPLVRALPPLLVLPLHAINGLNTALDLLFAEADQVRCGHRLLADRLFEVVLIQLLRWLLDHPPREGIAMGLMTGLADNALARTLTALHERPGAAWNLEKMAGQAGLSRSAFAARFKRLVGVTPAEYLTDWRMALTMQQLAQGRSIKCIADALGYANASALSRAFAQRQGQSPRHWLAAARLGPTHVPPP